MRGLCTTLTCLCVLTFGGQRLFGQTEAPRVAVDSSASAAVVASRDSGLVLNADDGPPQPRHPLLPILEYATTTADGIENDVRDYKCVLVKRERVGRSLGKYQHIMAKIRHERKEDDKIVVPFSVYLKFLGPSRYRDREVVYQRGRNNGDLVARRGGPTNPNLTLQLSPGAPLAMDGNRYPITEIGFKNLVERFIDVLGEDLKYNDCDVRVYKKAKVNGRECTHFQVKRRRKREGSRYHIASVYVDDEFRVPVYYAAYDWPLTGSTAPRLMEEYIYTKIELNVGFTDMDFDRANPEYKFSPVKQ